MRLPRLTASSSLYRTSSSHYRVAVGGNNALGTTGAESPIASRPEVIHPFPHLLCQPCSLDTSGQCTQYCVHCPTPFPSPQCSVSFTPCAASECCGSGQEPCYVPGKSQSCCSPGYSCCNPETNFCCPTEESCCGGACCPIGTACCGGVCCGSGECGCNGLCCPTGQCCNGACCSADQSCCDGVCCLAGQCCNGVCCQAGESCCVEPTGGSVCCSTGQCCNGVCCTTGTDRCCNGVCCPPDQCGCSGACCLAGQTCFNGCCATNTAGLTLSSGSNYLLSNGCQNIQGLKVFLDVTQDMVAAVTPFGGGPATQNGGFAMQLNAYNPEGPTTDWMQYIFLISGNAINYQVQYWDLAAACACGHAVCDCTGPLVNEFGTLLSLPSNTVPAGYALDIELASETNTGNITGATFTVSDGKGNTKSSTVTLDANHQFPIVAFQVNVVGPDNASSSQFSSGAGTIFYAVSSGQLCVEGGLPDLCSKSSGSDRGTAETSNAVYGPIEAPCCASELSQSLST
jgi:hypothetical protein